MLPLLKRITNDGDLLAAIFANGLRYGVPQAQAQGKDLARSVERTIDALHRFARALVHFALAQDSLRSNSGYSQRLALDSTIRSQPQWSELEVEWDEASDLLHTTVKACNTLLQSLDEARWFAQSATSTLLSDIKDVGNKLTELAQQLDLIIFSPEGSLRNVVTWLELNELGNAVSLAIAPAYVGDVLEKTIVHGKRSAIFTSATLRSTQLLVCARSAWGRGMCRLPSSKAPLTIKSTLLYLPSDLMMPNHINYQPAVEKGI